MGEIGEAKANPALLAVIKDINYAPDTRYAAATALGKTATPKEIEAIRALIENYPETATRQELLKAAK